MDLTCLRKGGKPAASTYLFVPANDPRKIEKALGCGSDAVILDLEDSVLEGQKEKAREDLAQMLESSPLPSDVEVWVRTNGFDTPFFEGDARRIPWSRVHGAVLPKAEQVESVHELVQAGARRVILLVESVRGFFALERLVSVPEVERVAIGTWDLLLDLGIVAVDDPDESEIIWQLRGQLVVESRRLGLKPPIDGIWSNYHDDEGLRDVSQRVMRMGFGGKLLVHPRQVPIVRTIFEPNPDAFAFAREVLAAYEEASRQGRGTVEVRGRAVDLPMVRRARLLLGRHGLQEITS